MRRFVAFREEPPPSDQRSSENDSDCPSGSVHKGRACRSKNCLKRDIVVQCANINSDRIKPDPNRDTVIAVPDVSVQLIQAAFGFIELFRRQQQRVFQILCVHHVCHLYLHQSRALACGEQPAF
jgi:hypothetical protein